MVLRKIQQKVLDRAALAVLACALPAAFAPARAADAPSLAPPPGIAPANVTLAAVLADYRKAAGRRAPGTPDTRVEHWKISFGSLSGTRDEWRSGADFRVAETLGPDDTGYGRRAGRPWNVNANGQVTYGHDLHQRDAVDARALRSPAHGGVALLGQTSSPAAYVVKVDPPGGRLQYVFFDKTTHLIDRVEQIREGRRIATTYSDYRTTRGLTEPWKVHSSDGFATNDDDESLQSLSIGDPVSDAELAVPAAAPPLLRIDAPSVAVPAAIVDDRIVVKARMGGHDVDFLMDSGADGIVIDNDVVAALKIKQYGRITSETAGTYVESSVILPDVQIGPLALHGVHAVSLPFEQFTSTGTPIAGLLGYDFIASLVWHVDYLHGTLQALDPARFVPPAGAHALDVTFDDRVPTLSASISGVETPALILDTGADRCTLFSPFVRAHAAAMPDRGLGLEMQAASPFINDFYGVGGTVGYRPLQAGPFVFGSWMFPKWLFYVTQNAPSFEFEDYDGLIGQDLLRNFDLYLDYPHSKVYLVPNDRFRQRWPA